MIIYGFYLGAFLLFQTTHRNMSFFHQVFTSCLCISSVDSLSARRIEPSGNQSFASRDFFISVYWLVIYKVFHISTVSTLKRIFFSYFVSIWIMDIVPISTIPFMNTFNFSAIYTKYSIILFYKIMFEYTHIT